MLTPLTLDGRPLSQTPRVTDLRPTDLVPLVRPSEPLPDDQNVHMRADRLQEMLGGTGSLSSSPSVTLYDTLGPHTDGAATQRLVTQVANRAANQRPGGPFQTTWFSNAQSAADPYGSASLETLLATRAPLFHLGCLITVEAPLPGAGHHYTLVYDGAARTGAAAPGLRVFKNGEMLAGELVPAMLVPADSPEAAVPDYVSFAAGYVFAADELIRAYVPGTTAQQFASRRSPGAASAPTAALLDFTSSPNGADVNWKFVGRDAAAGGYQALTLAAAQALQGTGDPAITYTILRAGGNVTLAYIAADAVNGLPGGFEPTGVWQQLDGRKVFVDYDVVSDVVKVRTHVWMFIGNSGNNNIGRGPEGTNITYGPNHYSNTYGFDHRTNVYGSGHYYNTYGGNHRYNTYGEDLTQCVFGDGHSSNIYGNGIAYCTFGDNCEFLQVGDNCTRVRVYNCQGTDPTTPFVIPAGSIDKEYRNNALYTGIVSDALKADLTGATFTGDVLLPAAPSEGNATNANRPVLYGEFINAVNGLAWKNRVRLATQVNDALTGVSRIIDGKTVVSGNRVLVRAQTNLAENGIYVAAAGAWARAADAATWAALISATVRVSEGTLSADLSYNTPIDEPGTIGTTPMPWVDISGGTTYNFGTGLTVSANNVSLNLAGVYTWSARQTFNGGATVLDATNPTDAMAYRQRLQLGTTAGTAADGLALANAQRLLPFTTVAATAYTLTTADFGTVVRINSATAATVTVPLGLATGVGAHIEVRQAGAGQVTLAFASGVTSNAFPAGATKTAGQHASVYLHDTAANIFNLASAVV